MVSRREWLTTARLLATFEPSAPMTKIDGYQTQRYSYTGKLVFILEYRIHPRADQFVRESTETARRRQSRHVRDRKSYIVAKHTT